MAEKYRVLEACKASVVAVVDLALVVDYCEELVVVQCLRAGVPAHMGDELVALVVVGKGTYVPLPSRAAVVYWAMLIDDGTRTGVSILYVSAPRCSKRCAVRVKTLSLCFVKWVDH